MEIGQRMFHADCKPQQEGLSDTTNKQTKTPERWLRGFHFARLERSLGHPKRFLHQ
jgi:hypothetical protein